MRVETDTAASDYGVAVTPSDSTEHALSIGVHVGGDGNLVIEGKTGGAVSYAVKGGATYPFRVRKVMAATTATGIVLLYRDDT